MGHEFNNRISAQRELLRTINRKPWTTEDLFGLSSKAIERWTVSNRLGPTSRIVHLVNRASEKLFFLANRSQDQISEQYHLVRAEIIAIQDEIRQELDAPMPTR